jgi:hypothetical protein
MLEINNRTPFSVALLPYTDKIGINHAGVVIKGTWSIGAHKGAEAELALAEAQRPVRPADERNGDKPGASLRYAADVGWPKPATDVVLVGHAHAGRDRASSVDVALRVGPLAKTVRVLGDRVWFKAAGDWGITRPQPFECMPLVYERAFGGKDETHAAPKKHGWEPRNPVGTGFAVAAEPARLEGLALPNLEDPRAPIKSWKDRPAPAGFGLIDGYWAPRAGLAGTYDASWKAARAPLLPDDFDERFFNAANPDLVAPGYLTGGEAVSVTNVTASGPLSFRLPRRRLSVVALVKAQTIAAEPRLDTVWIDADARELVMVWRAAVTCPRSFVAVQAVFVKEGDA